MNNANVSWAKYERLLYEYFSSQAYAYIFAAIFFISHYTQIKALFFIGFIFVGVSIMLLMAPLNKKLRKIATELDTWLRGGLFIASAAILIIDGMLGSLRTNIGEILFWTLLSWLFILVITNAIVISKRIGIIKFVFFGLAGFGLLMIFSGYRQTTYYVIALVGLLLSIPLIDSMLHEKLDSDHKK